MGLKIKDDSFKGLQTDSYTRIKNTGSHINGLNKQLLVVERYSTQEYREDYRGDCEELQIEVEYTDEELQTMYEIRYAAMKRLEQYQSAEDC